MSVSYRNMSIKDTSLLPCLKLSSHCSPYQTNHPGNFYPAKGQRCTISTFNRTEFQLFNNVRRHTMKKIAIKYEAELTASAILLIKITLFSPVEILSMPKLLYILCRIRFFPSKFNVSLR